ncbi:MAG: cytochrome c biogenesis protein CcsA [Phaeodactylibacter sp.]|uniref:cytochrome c biogenesis protein n=1 Tax=Phaeodactylibacter sp. TaxID=1940289 RepID=UPI0032ED6709
MKMLKLIFNRLFSTSAAGLYMILFAIAIGGATFIENDFGTSAAQKVVFKSWWLELLMGLFSISLLVNIFRFRMIPQKKWAVLSFHAAIVIIIAGAAVTRYYGFEGMMHIREGSSANTFLSAETYLLFEAQQKGNKYRFDEPVLFASLGNNHFREPYQLGSKTIEVEVTEFMPNPKEFLLNDETGLPTLQIVIGGANGREEYYLQEGQRSRIRGTLFNFTDREDPQAFNIKLEAGQPYFKAPATFTQMVMATQEKDTLAAGQYHPLQLRSLYASGQQSFVFGQFTPTGLIELASSNRKMESNSTAGLKVKVSDGTNTQEQYIFGSKGVEGRPRTFLLGDLQLSVAYGSKRVQLPFALKLRDFIIEKYPGTNSASSYASEVTLLDSPNNVNHDQRIYMNNILNYGGYRFFQSSFDPDELGTYLSVNHDWWGTWISYLGYAILTIGMILTFFSRKSRFQQLARNLEKMRSQPQSALILLPVLLASNLALAAPAPNYIPGPAVSLDHAERFGRLIMQDHRGRMKPLNTYASEILRKLSRKETVYGLTAEQAIISMAAHPKDWYHIPLIKMGKHDKTRNLIPVEGKLAAYSDFFDQNGKYILQEHVRQAYNTPKKDRGVFEKEMMKLDERVNICNMVFSGSFLKVFPIPGDPNHHWESPNDAHRHGQQEASFGQRFYDAYIPTVQTALHESDWALANRLIDELRQFQYKNGAAVIPSEGKVNAEILLNRLNVFSRLGKVYALLGLAFLGLLFARVFKPGLRLKWATRIALGIFLACFAMHAFGLGLRWYVSGRAPWSNGYESMIYIAFTTVLAGVLFGRKALGSLAATCILAATILMVAGLSWLDPEITPLVPVLKSYWLTIHVSLEAGSYGFLMLGALIGVINLLFMIFRNTKNADNVNRIIKEMTQISEMTLIGGLVMVSVGTYLGGVWANESWGRYWGWDAKETWALVTILVYAFILHMRFIPGFRGAYAFNVASLFGWASVIMTYFGVNYYLSGLHSYAAGDPVPIPSFVYYAVFSLTIISLLALWRNWQFNKASK